MQPNKHDPAQLDDTTLMGLGAERLRAPSEQPLCDQTLMTRPVSTLSGGEGFQAAPGLALGLAETVQAYAGGLHVDAIFIDEGFGSLDPEAPELANDTLIDLQRAGRLVGIISHVPELKERLDVRLEVSAGRSGSAARFVVG